MAYKDKYEYFYNLIPQKIEKYKENGKELAIGYTSDLDVLLEWDKDTVNDIFSAYLKTEPVINSNDTIDSIESLARILGYYMINGLGGEADITDSKVCDYLSLRFNTKNGLGGTCAQQAVAIGKIGIPALVHITDRSKEVCEFMDGVGLNTVTEKGVVPLMESATDDPPVLHMILQFPKGEKIVINGRTVEIPLSNRLILDFDMIHKHVPLEKPFLNYCENNAEKLALYSISGFNAILDPAIMRQRVDELTAHFNNIKSKNQDCMVYLEGAFYLNPEVKDVVFGELANSIDFLGMNEEELVEHVEKHGKAIDKDSFPSVLNGLEHMLQKFPVTGIILHTKDYSMYYGTQVKTIDVEMGLTMGNLLSGTRARIGEYGSYKDCSGTLELPLSEVGIAFAEQLEKILSNRYIKIVPSRYLEHPRCTIGLGDTFVAGFLTAFVSGDADGGKVKKFDN
jgi:ADP-dependent phosphofructokinase/glucokinase